jgi:hypothetical protein
MDDAQRLVAFSIVSTTTRNAMMSDSCSNATFLRCILRQIE